MVQNVIYLSLKSSPMGLLIVIQPFIKYSILPHYVNKIISLNVYHNGPRRDPRGTPINTFQRARLRN